MMLPNCSLLFLSFLCLTGMLRAQTEETIFTDAEVVGGFGGPLITTGSGDGEYGVGFGGGGGVIVNQFFFGGFGLGESYGRRKVDNTNYTLALGYGGVWLGYVHNSHKLVHPYTSIKVGWGSVDLEDIDDDDDLYDSDGVFVVNPEIGVELNLLHWFRVAATGGYRFVTGVEDERLPGIGSNDFNSPTFALTFRFGAFGHGRGNGGSWDDDPDSW